MSRRDCFRSWYQGPHPILITVFTWNIFHFYSLILVINHGDIYCEVGQQYYNWVLMVVSQNFSFVSFSNWHSARQKWCCSKPPKNCSRIVVFLLPLVPQLVADTRSIVSSNPKMPMVSSATTSDAQAWPRHPTQQCSFLPTSKLQYIWPELGWTLKSSSAWVFKYPINPLYHHFSGRPAWSVQKTNIWIASLGCVQPQWEV